MWWLDKKEMKELSQWLHVLQSFAVGTFQKLSSCGFWILYDKAANKQGKEQSRFIHI